MMDMQSDFYERKQAHLTKARDLAARATDLLSGFDHYGPPPQESQAAQALIALAQLELKLMEHEEYIERVRPSWPLPHQQVHEPEQLSD